MAKIAQGQDPLNAAERSARMAKVRQRGNRSTEEAVAAILEDCGVVGYVRHPREILGKPDFYFPDIKLAIFVDGCFWHGCSVCNRNIPRTRSDFWLTKIAENRARDQRTTRKLRTDGYHVIRIWEHDIRPAAWVPRVRRMLTILGPGIEAKKFR